MNQRRRLAVLGEAMETRLVLSPVSLLPLSRLDVRDAVPAADIENAAGAGDATEADGQNQQKSERQQDSRRREAAGQQPPKQETLMGADKSAGREGNDAAASSDRTVVVGVAETTKSGGGESVVVTEQGGRGQTATDQNTTDQNTTDQNTTDQNTTDQNTTDQNTKGQLQGSESSQNSSEPATRANRPTGATADDTRLSEPVIENESDTQSRPADTKQTAQKPTPTDPSSDDSDSSAASGAKESTTDSDSRQTTEPGTAPTVTTTRRSTSETSSETTSDSGSPASTSSGSTADASDKADRNSEEPVRENRTVLKREEEAAADKPESVVSADDVSAKAAVAEAEVTEKTKATEKSEDETKTADSETVSAESETTESTPAATDGVSGTPAEGSGSGSMASAITQHRVPPVSPTAVNVGSGQASFLNRSGLADGGSVFARNSSSVRSVWATWMSGLTGEHVSSVGSEVDEASQSFFGDATRLGLLLATVRHVGVRKGAGFTLADGLSDSQEDHSVYSRERRRRRAAAGRRAATTFDRLRQTTNPLESVDEYNAIACATPSCDEVFADAAIMSVLYQLEDDTVDSRADRGWLFGGLLAGAAGVAARRAAKSRKVPTRPLPATPRYSGQTLKLAD